MNAKDKAQQNCERLGKILRITSKAKEIANYYVTSGAEDECYKEILALVLTECGLAERQQKAGGQP